MDSPELRPISSLSQEEKLRVALAIARKHRNPTLEANILQQLRAMGITPPPQGDQ